MKPKEISDQIFIFLGLFTYTLGKYLEGREGDQKHGERLWTGKGQEEMVSKHTTVLFKTGRIGTK